MSSSSRKIANRFKDLVPIGKGSFSKVYKATDVVKNKECALKVECMKGKEHPRLSREVNIYKTLKGGPGIADIYWFGTNDEDNIMALKLLGPSLGDRFKERGTFGVRTIVRLGYQIVDRIKYFHEHGYVHCDIKPENFAVGLSHESDTLYIIDFGLTKSYLNPKTGSHVEPKTGRKFCGTPRYASINAHQGKTLSRRDDLQAIGFMLIYLYKGCVPWNNIPETRNDEKIREVKKDKKLTDDEKFKKIYALERRAKERKIYKIGKLKEENKFKILKTLPSFLVKYMEAVYDLKFEEEPDYDYLTSLFSDYAKSNKIELHVPLYGN